jgi:hypothetical protein
MSRYFNKNVVTAAAQARTIVGMALAAATAVVVVRCSLLPTLEWLQPSTKVIDSGAKAFTVQIDPRSTERLVRGRGENCRAPEESGSSEAR